MPMPTLKAIASLLPPGATIQSDHQGIDALLSDIRGQISDEGVGSSTRGVTKVAFERVDFIKTAPRRPDWIT